MENAARKNYFRFSMKQMRMNINPKKKPLKHIYIFKSSVRFCTFKQCRKSETEFSHKVWG